jgi:protein arginine N-methyltransferase 3
MILFSVSRTRFGVSAYSSPIESQSGDWSDEEGVGASSGAPKELESALRRIKALEANLSKAKQALVDYRGFVTKSLDVEKLADAVASSSTEDPVVQKRDDDSHYFTSYGSNGICYPYYLPTAVQSG